MRAPGAGQVAHLSIMYKDVQHSGVLVEQVPHTRAHTPRRAHARTHGRAFTKPQADARTYVHTNRQTHPRGTAHTHTRARAHTKAFGWQFKAVAAAKEKIDLWETVVVAEGNW